MNTALMFSSAKDEWSTPQPTYDALEAEFGFTLDCAASADNHKCAQWLGPGGLVEDALTVRWRDVATCCWLNPPYSRTRAFIAAAAQAAADGCTVVALVAARTDTRCWHDYVWDRHRHTPRAGVEVRFIQGRLKFSGAKDSAPFPSVVLVFRPHALAVPLEHQARFGW